MTAKLVRRKSSRSSHDREQHHDGRGSTGFEDKTIKSADPLTRVIRNSTVQPKLKIGKPNDKFEQEADSTADNIVNAPQEVQRAPEAEIEEAPVQAKSLIQTQENEEEKVAAKSLVQLQTEEEEPVQQQPQEEEETVQQQTEEEEVQRQEEEEAVQQQPLEEEPVQKQEDEEESVQQKPIIRKEGEKDKEDAVQSKGGEGRSAGPGFQSTLYGSKGSGNPMSKDTRSSMEGHFDADFSKVRIHTDSKAVQMNKDIGAQAFTHGKDIYFNRGKYSPDSSRGKHLLAHELTHVVQQNPRTVRASRPGSIVSHSNENKIQRSILGKLWGGVKAVGNYIGRTAESFAGFLWTIVTKFPIRFVQWYSHIRSAGYKIPLWIWEGFKQMVWGNKGGVRDWLIGGIVGGAAWVGRFFAQTLTLFGVGEAWDFGWQLIKFYTRKLTSTERDEAKTIFGDTISYWRVRIDEKYSIIAHVGKIFTGKVKMGVATGHTINFTRKINASKGNPDMGWLIHELTHVAQMEKVGLQYIGEALHGQATGGYKYGTLTTKSKLRDFNREQQGRIAEHCYNGTITGTIKSNMETAFKNGDL